MKFINEKRTEIVATIIIVALLYLLDEGLIMSSILLFSTVPFIWKWYILGTVTLVSTIAFYIIIDILENVPGYYGGGGYELIILLVAILIGIVAEIFFPKILKKIKQSDRNKKN